MKRSLWMGLLVASLVLMLAGPAVAQTYSFTLTKETVNAYWDSDGTLTLDYVFVFANDAGASPIDFVDVGLPNNAPRRQILADVDGHALSDIQKSDYVANGVAVGLGRYAIPAGKTGTVHVVIEGLTQVLYPDSQDDTYASAAFGTTWFDAAVVHGKTNLTIIYHLPPGINPDEPRYHAGATAPLPSAPKTAFDDEGRVTYTWQTASANGSTQYAVGASFPARVVPEGAIVRTSWLDAMLSALGDMSGCCLPAGFVLFWVGLMGYGAWSASRRKMQYLPPKISIEGHGIKRGLTAVEAAVLMEQPLDKVLTMILFAVIKKGAASVLSQSPLRLQVATKPPATLYEYEADFLKAFERGDAKSQKTGLQTATVNLIKSVSQKMKGFSRKESVAYYKTIIDKAWAQVQAAATPEVKGQKFDEVMDWTLLDQDFTGRSRDVFGAGPVFVPTWWGRYSPPIHTSSAGPALPMGGLPTGALPHLPGADFAASIANGVQNFSASVVGNLSDFTGAVTNTTNPPPKTTSSSSGGGGRSCACACACAGCACACAGGGR